MGIPRGGLVVAVRLSHLLDVPLIDSTVHLLPTSTLVVDDIADTGRTLERFRKGCVHVYIATLYYHKQSSVVPDFWVREKTDKWIVFPWEQVI